MFCMYFCKMFSTNIFCMLLLTYGSTVDGLKTHFYKSDESRLVGSVFTGLLPVKIQLFPYQPIDRILRKSTKLETSLQSNWGMNKRFQEKQIFWRHVDGGGRNYTVFRNTDPVFSIFYRYPLCHTHTRRKKSRPASNSQRGSFLLFRPIPSYVSDYGVPICA